MSFKDGDLVWAKIKGYPYWPAKVSRIHFCVQIPNLNFNITRNYIHLIRKLIRTIIGSDTCVFAGFFFFFFSFSV